MQLFLVRNNIDITFAKTYNKSNVYEKKDLKHLSRRELVDLICEMEKTNLLVDVQALEEAKKEQRRLKDRSAYRQTFRGTVAAQNRTWKLFCRSMPKKSRRF